MTLQVDVTCDPPTLVSWSSHAQRRTTEMIGSLFMVLVCLEQSPSRPAVCRHISGHLQKTDWKLSVFTYSTTHLLPVRISRFTSDTLTIININLSLLICYAVLTTPTAWTTPTVLSMLCSRSSHMTVIDLNTVLTQCRYFMLLVTRHCF